MKRGIIVKNNLFAEIYGEKELADIARSIDLYEKPVTTAEVKANPAILRDVQIIMSEWGCFCFDADMLRLMPRLEAVFYAGGTIRYIVSSEFWSRRIVICSAYGANAVSVAQFTVAQILCGVKQVWNYAHKVREAKTFVPKDVYRVPGSYGTTLGVISMGMIGRKVCEYIQAVTEMRILAYDPFVSPDEARRLNIELCSLDDIFRRSDVVSLHTPLLEETVGMIKGDHFRMMKPDSTFINTARGAVVRECEMIEVLQARPDITAVLDVTDPEPPVESSPLYRMNNVVLTPHLAGCVGAECIRMGRYMTDELKRYVAGEPLKWQITEAQAKRLA